MKDKMKKNKSQITMLMILGLVIFIIVSLVLYLAKYSIKKQSQQGTKKLQETAIEPQPIKEFVAKCLDKTAKDAVVLLGKQGGRIYASQGGILVDYQEGDEGDFFINYENSRVSYNIQRQKFAPLPYASEIPDYPWKTFPYETATSNAEIFDGYFGVSNIPPLNASEGPNSVQEQIEGFIKNNLQKCLDFNVFNEQGFEISQGQPKASVIIGDNGLNVKVKMPLEINNPKTGEFTELSDFSAYLDIRLKGVYFFAKGLIDNDIKNIKFDIGNASNSQDSMRIKLFKDAYKDVHKKGDIIIVTDEKSIINGKPYQYIFSRENREPALHYIRPNVFTFQSGYKINQTDLLQDKPLKAYDPDQDNYTFSIYVGEFGATPATFPKTLDQPQIKFRIEVNDGKLIDYQILIVNRAG